VAGDDPKLTFLAGVPLFAELGTDELDAVAAHLREVDAAAGTTVIEEGDEGGEFFIVASGALEIRSDGRLLAELGPGDFAGEMALLFGGRRNASAIAVQPSRLLVMGREEFTGLIQDSPAVEGKLLNVVAQRMRYH
jgi:CRP-like cAMP-binding protein